MENIFHKTGYRISKIAVHADSPKIHWLQINNPDGSPRWIWNAENKQPLFLKFYNVGSWRAFLFATLIKIVFLIRIQKWVFKKQTYFIKPANNMLFDYQKSWAIFTGTVGPNNKVLLFDGEKFIKIATTTNAELLLDNEFKIIQTLNKTETSFDYPKVLANTHDSLSLSDISKNGTRLKELNANALDTLVALYNIENQQVKIKDWDYLNKLKEKFRNIKNDRIPKNMLRKINLLLETIDSEDVVELSFSHGDFTPWNMYEVDQTIALYDWELASTNKPKGFDFFHFIIQNDVMVARKPWKDIYENIQHQAKSDFYSTVFNENPEELKRYLKWYFIINGLHYLDVYASQKEWHIQIDWLLEVWNQGLDLFLTEQKSSRALVIMDLFDSIHNQEYAALKFQNGTPENLDLNADIDLVIERKLSKSIVQFLENHALVSKITVSEKSFMNTIQVFTNEGDILSIDLIWQLKRRNLEILNVKEILDTKYTNLYGVKNASNLYTARYIVLFYILNNAKIPSKYLVYEEAIRNSEKAMDLLIKDYFTNDKKHQQILTSFIKRDKRNHGFSFLKNTINYLIDTARNAIANKGFTITFSGVDGAGKTTVIENIAFRVEKRLRKPVVVLRHRPSMLPILSVWTKGKEKAHQDTISSLPRQGTNSSFLSSLLRFSYYYVDYLIGQFVIYFKYILRGYVVIYDRYYFDFINDSKRSNIVLSKKMIEIGYRFLLKPKFNFFLYADAKTILKRKQELDESTIVKLTNDYNSLFQALQLETNATVYRCIDNEDLETTLTSIFRTIEKNK